MGGTVTNMRCRAGARDLIVAPIPMSRKNPTGAAAVWLPPDTPADLTAAGTNRSAR